MAALTTTYSGVLAVILSFLSMRLLLVYIKSHVRYPCSISEGPPRKQWMYRNITISLVHSFITAVFSIYCFYDEPALLSDMLGNGTWVSYYLICFSLGYFIHDFFDLLLNDLKNSGVILMHHLVVFVAFGIVVFSERYLGFAMCALLMEINSIFLHSRRLMSYHGYSKTSMQYEINGILLLITFVMFRFLSSGWMLNFVIKNRHVLSPAIAFCGSFGMGILIVINILLFLLIWNSDFRKRLQIKDDY